MLETFVNCFNSIIFYNYDVSGKKVTVYLEKIRFSNVPIQIYSKRNTSNRSAKKKTKRFVANFINKT